MSPFGFILGGYVTSGYPRIPKNIKFKKKKKIYHDDDTVFEYVFNLLLHMQSCILLITFEEF